MPITPTLGHSLHQGPVSMCLPGQSDPICKSVESCIWCPNQVSIWQITDVRSVAYSDQEPRLLIRCAGLGGPLQRDHGNGNGITDGRLIVPASLSFLVSSPLQLVHGTIAQWTLHSVQYWEFVFQGAVPSRHWSKKVWHCLGDHNIWSKVANN